MEVIKECGLGNGLTIRYLNCSRRYFHDYFHVRVEISCDIPDEGNQACRGGDSSVVDTFAYKRSMEKMGVPSLEVDSVIDDLIAAFEEHSLPYIAAPAFPQKFLLQQHAALKRKMAVSSPAFYI